MSELCRLRRSEGYEVCDDAEAEVYKSPRPAAATLPRLTASPSEACPATDPPAASSGSRSDENVSPRRSACAQYRL